LRRIEARHAAEMDAIMHPKRTRWQAFWHWLLYLGT
jgi:hypothetical protein